MDSLVNAAEAALYEKNLIKAHPLWVEVCEQNPGEADHWIILAAINKALGYMDAAFENVNLAFHLNPDIADAWSLVAELHWHCAKVSEALLAGQTAAKLAPADSDKCLQYADYLIHAHHFDTAKQQLKTLGEKRYSDQYAAELMLKIYIGQSQFNRAQQFVRRLKQPIKETAQLDYYLALLEQDNSKAQIHLARCLAKDSHHIFAASKQLRLHNKPIIGEQRTQLLSTYYEQKATAYALLRPADDQKILQQIGNQLKHCGAKNILDVGCGNGELSQYVNQDVSLIGIDLCPRMLEIAALNQRYGVLCHWDVTTNKIPHDMKFDAIVLHNALHEIEHPLENLNNLLSYLYHDGVCFISLKNTADQWFDRLFLKSEDINRARFPVIRFDKVLTNDQFTLYQIRLNQDKQQATRALSTNWSQIPERLKYFSEISELQHLSEQSNIDSAEKLLKKLEYVEKNKPQILLVKARIARHHQEIQQAKKYYKKLWV